MSFFRWCMRHGAKLLFSLALVQLVLGVGIPIYARLVETPQSAGVYTAQSSDLLLHLSLILQSLGGVTIPLLGALLIDRIDRWLALKGRTEAAE